MIYRFSPYNDRTTAISFFQELSNFTADEINKIREIGDSLPKTDVKLYGNYDRSRVHAEGSHFPLNDDTRWIYKKYSNIIMSCNARSFKYDLTGLEENLYYHTYSGNLEHHFGWHYDMGPETPSPRKLSFSLQLSGEEEYTGGDLEFMDLDTPLQASKSKGLIVAFPSYKAHRVTTVHTGVRRVLVAFAVGPNFR